jgi:hypothetical protein
MFIRPSDKAVVSLLFSQVVPYPNANRKNSQNADYLWRPILHRRVSRKPPPECLRRTARGGLWLAPRNAQTLPVTAFPPTIRSIAALIARGLRTRPKSCAHAVIRVARGRCKPKQKKQIHWPPSKWNITSAGTRRYPFVTQNAGNPRRRLGFFVFKYLNVCLAGNARNTSME